MDIFEELLPHVGEIFFQKSNKGSEMPINKQIEGADSILNILEQGPMHIDILIEKTGMSAQELMHRLISLEMKGIIRQLPGKMYVKE